MTHIAQRGGARVMTPAEDQVLAANPQLASIFEMMEFEEAQRTSQARGAFGTVDATRGNLNSAIAVKSNYLASARATPDPQQIAVYDASIAKERRFLLAAERTSADANNASTGAKQILSACRTYIAEAIGRGTKHFDQSLVKLRGDDYLKVAAQALAEIVELRKSRKTISSAPRPFAEAVADVAAQLDELVSGAPFTVSLDRDGPSIDWPVVATGGESDGRGGIPHAPDARAIITALFRDRLIAEGERQLALHYEDIDLTLSATDQRRKLAGLDAEILQLERREAAAIWQARTQGVDVYHRANADPRAVLGIEGPPPSKRRD